MPDTSHIAEDGVKPSASSLGPLHGVREAQPGTITRGPWHLYQAEVQSRVTPSLSDAVSETVDAIGFGWFQVLMLLMTGGIMFAEGAEMLVMGSITTLLHDHWDLSPVMRGSMVSVVFVGFAVGNMISGQIGDRWGRRKGVLLGYFLIASFGFATACATGPLTMLSLRFGVGIGCGIGFPAVYSLIPEVCPMHLRGSVSTLMIGFMPLGELFAAYGVLLIDPTLDRSTRHCEVGYFPSRGLANPTECSWKTLCEFSALPSFALLVAASFCLYESPHYLAASGRFEELEEVLSTMASMNGARNSLDLARVRCARGQVPQASDSPCSSVYSFSNAVKRVFEPNWRDTTLFMFFAHFTKDFSVFGLAYALPQYFSFLQSYTVGMQLIFMSALAFPGVWLACIVTRLQTIGHITSLTLSAGFCGMFALGMLEAAPVYLAAPCAYAVKLTALAYFIMVVVYTAEVFPTSIRNTAVGICTCAGRLGSISAPLIFELSLHHSKSFDYFMWSLFALMFLVAATARYCLVRDPKGKGLIGDTASSPAKGKYGALEC